MSTETKTNVPCIVCCAEGVLARAINRAPACGKPNPVKIISASTTVMTKV